MLGTDLIKLLEDLIEKHKAVEEHYGPAQIMFDVFSREGEAVFVYSGLSPNAVISWSEDGVYPILMTLESFRTVERNQALKASGSNPAS